MSAEARGLIVALFDSAPASMAEWGALRAWLLTPETPQPVVLLVSDAVYDGLPRSFDDLPGVQIERVERAAVARRRIGLLCGLGAVIAAVDWGVAPFERWVAIDWRGGTLSEAPADWRTQHRAHGRLDELPAAEPLDGLGIAPAEPPPPLPTGVQLRAYIAGVAAGTEGTPAVRLAHALALGVTAGVTEAERVSLQLEQAARVPVERVSAADLAERLEAASRSPVQAILRTDEQWHWINVTPPPELAGAAQLTHHEIEAPTTALRRLRRHVAGWTEADWLADPLFARAVASLSPEPAERDAFALARSWLARSLTGGWPADAAAVVPEGRRVLEALLNAPSGAAGLRVHVAPDAAVVPGPAERWRDPSIGLFPAWPQGGLRWLTRDDPPLLVATGQTAVAVEDPAALQLQAHVPEPVPVDDDARFMAELAGIGVGDAAVGGPLLAEFKELVEQHARRNFGGLAWLTQSRAVVQAFGARTGLDVDAALARYAASGDANQALAMGGGPRGGGAAYAVTHAAVEIAPAVWSEADRLAAQLRQALERALGSGRGTALPDGSWLVALRGGLDALITLTTAPEQGHRVGFVVGVDAQTRQIGLRAEGEQPGLLHGGALPLGAVLAGGGYAAHIRFVSNPFS